MFVCTDLLLHITMRVYTDLKHYNYIMEVKCEICGKHKAHTVSEKQGWGQVQLTKYSSTPSTPNIYQVQVLVKYSFF